MTTELQFLTDTLACYPDKSSCSCHSIRVAVKHLHASDFVHPYEIPINIRVFDAEQAFTGAIGLLQVGGRIRKSIHD